MGTCLSQSATEQKSSEEEAMHSDEGTLPNIEDEPTAIDEVNDQLIPFDNKLIQLSLCYPTTKRYTIK